MAKGTYSFEGPVGTVKFDWNADREPTQDELEQIYLMARGNTPPPQMQGPLAETGRTGQYNPAGPGKDFSFLKEELAQPKRNVDLLGTMVKEAVTNPRALLTGQGSDIHTDPTTGALQTTPIEEQISRDPRRAAAIAITAFVPPLAPYAGAIAGALPQGAQDTAAAIGRPIINTVVGAGFDPLTYVAFHRGPALIQKGAAILFGGKAAIEGLLGLGEAATKARGGDYNGALESLIGAGMSGGMAVLMIGQLKGGKSVKDVVTDAAQGKGPFSGAPLETQFRNIGQQQYGLNDLAQEGMGPKGAIERQFGGVKAGEFSLNELGQLGQAGAIEGQAATMRAPRPLDWETVGNQDKLNKDIVTSQEAQRGREEIRTTAGGAPIDTPIALVVESEYQRVRDKGKKVVVTGGKDLRIKEPPFTTKDLTGLDPQYQEPSNGMPPPVGTPEFEAWMNNPERGALVLGGPAGSQAPPQRRRPGQPAVPKAPTLGDMLYEGRRNFLLPGTVMGKKIASDVVQQGEHPFLRAVSAGIDNLHLRQAFERTMGKPSPDVERHFSDVGEHFKALMDPRVGKAALEAAKAGWNETSYDVNPHSTQQAIPGKLGRAIRIPQRAISVPTNFAMELTRGTEQRVWAGREAKAMGLSGDAYNREVTRRANLPLSQLPVAVREKIIKMAAEKTLLGASGDIARNINAWRQAGFKWISPFFQVSSNMVKNVYQRTPAYYGELAYKVKKGQLSGGELSDEMAKPLLYIPLFMGLLSAAKKGFLTGSGPAVKKMEYNKLDTGWQPDSAKLPEMFGGAYVSHKALGPISHVLSLAADFVEATDEKDKKRYAQKMWNAMSDNFTPSTIQDIGGILGLLHWDDMGFTKKLSKVGGTFLSGLLIPRVISKLATATDTDASGQNLLTRKLDSPLDYVKRDIPGLRETLPILRAPTGKPVTREAPGSISGQLNPFQVSHDRGDVAVEKMFEKIDWLPRGTQNSESIMTPVGKLSIDLTPEEQKKLLDANLAATTVAKRIVQSPGFQSLPNGIKKIELMKVYQAFRVHAMNEIKPGLYKRAFEQIKGGGLPEQGR